MPTFRFCGRNQELTEIRRWLEAYTFEGEVDHGPFNKSGFLAHSHQLHNIMTGFPVTAKEYTESEIGNQVIVWATSKALLEMM
jgi:hypothetical protein